MKASLVYWHKARIQGRYIVELEIHEIGKSTKYPEGVKFGLICKDLKTGKQILMDNHHPKGPHVHISESEIPYQYVNEERLLKDFQELVLQQMGVKL